MTATWLSTGAIMIVGLTLHGGGLAAARLGLKHPAVPLTSRATSAPRVRRCSRTAAFRAKGRRARDRPRRRAKATAVVNQQAQGFRPDQRSQRLPANLRQGKRRRRRAAREIPRAAPRAARPPNRNRVRRANKGPPSRIRPKVKTRDRTAAPRKRPTREGCRPELERGRKDTPEQNDEKSSDEKQNQSQRYGRSTVTAPAVLIPGPVLVTGLVHRRRSDRLDLRPDSPRIGLAPSLLALLASIFGGLFIEKEKNGKDPAAVSEPVRRLGRSPRSPTRSTSDWTSDSVPTTWSSTASRP